MQWLDIRLQLIGVAVVSVLGVIAVIQHQYASVDPGESTSTWVWYLCSDVSHYHNVFCWLCCPLSRPGGSLLVLLPVHHYATVWPHIQLHPDRDAAGECGKNRGILH